MDARQQLHAEDGHEEDPIIVYDDLEVDEHGRPARWLWHVECIRCGQPLPYASAMSARRRDDGG